MNISSRFELLPAASLSIPADRPHTHPAAQIDALRRSLREFGFVVPLVVDSSGTVIDGAAVLTAALEEGLDTVPCVIAEHLTPPQLRALHLAVNRLSEQSAWDRELLSAELCFLRDAGYDITLTGFDDSAILVEPLTASEDDFDPTPIENPRCKSGEVWQLGRHRLLVGDATNAEAVSRLFDGAAASMLLTDPPYGIKYEGHDGNRKMIANDDLMGDALYQLLSASFSVARAHLEPGSPFYIWHPDSLPALQFRAAAADNRLKVRQTLVWVKPSAVLSRQDYNWQHESCLHGEADGTLPLDAPGTWDAHETALYGWTDGARHRWCSDHKQTTVVEFPRPARSAEHPTMKPICLFAYCIANSTLINAVVFDPFCGSGTTVIACEQLRRSAYVCELDPAYADVIIRRWEALTGKEATRL